MAQIQRREVVEVVLWELLTSQSNQQAQALKDNQNDWSRWLNQDTWVTLAEWAL